MISAPQRAAAALGKGGCYLLCIFRLAEKLTGKFLDPLIEFADAITCGRVTKDAYVLQADVLMADYLGGAWRVLKAGDGADSAGRPYDLPLSYETKPGELEVQRWELDGVPGHFVLPDWDPYGESQSRLDGQLVSKRIFRRIS